MSIICDEKIFQRRKRAFFTINYRLRAFFARPYRYNIRYHLSKDFFTEIIVYEKTVYVV